MCEISKGKTIDLEVFFSDGLREIPYYWKIVKLKCIHTYDISDLSNLVNLNILEFVNFIELQGFFSTIPHQLETFEARVL